VTGSFSIANSDIRMMLLSSKTVFQTQSFRFKRTIYYDRCTSGTFRSVLSYCTRVEPNWWTVFSRYPSPSARKVLIRYPIAELRIDRETFDCDVPERRLSRNRGLIIKRLLFWGWIVILYFFAMSIARAHNIATKRARVLERDLTSTPPLYMPLIRCIFVSKIFCGEIMKKIENLLKLVRKFKIFDLATD
jgi:hypothetical protein